MNRDKLLELSPGARVEWLRSLSYLEGQDWAVGDSLFCLHCDDCFLAEEISCDVYGCPVCPKCKEGCPMDFAKVPWWRPESPVNHV